MPITKPPVKNIWADTGDKTEPTAGEVATGWPLSSTPPSRQRFNWILNYCANAVRYFSRRGLADYDAAETYIIGDRVIGDDGNTYKSLQNPNINHTPSTSPTFWEFWATASTADVTGAADNNAKLASTAWCKFGFAILVAANGYIKFPTWLGGFVIQWGQVAITGGSITSAWPIAFPNNLRMGVAFEVAGNAWLATQAYVLGLSMLSSTASNAVIYARAVTNGGGVGVATCSAGYIAIGT